MGLWGWTAFYAGVNEGEVLNNAEWLAEHPNSFCYDHCYIDEGYDYGRGDYAAANATHFAGDAQHRPQNPGYGPEDGICECRPSCVTDSRGANIAPSIFFD